MLIALLWGAGCNRGEGDANDLAVSSDEQARAVVNDAVAGLARGDVASVVARFCDQSDDGRALAEEIVAPAAGRRDLRIVRSEPAWKGAVPFFYVEVQSSDGPPGSPLQGRSGPGYVHGFGVRVRDGCLDRAVGATVLERNAKVPRRP